MNKKYLFVVVTAAISAQACTSVDRKNISQKTLLRTLEHQQEIDKEKGQAWSSTIEEESVFNGVLGGIWCALRLDKECQGKD